LVLVSIVDGEVEMAVQNHALPPPTSPPKGVKQMAIGMPKVVSLFSGCGGLDLGFREAGFDLVYASDNDPAAVDAYARNVDDQVLLRDVTSDDFKDDIKNLGKCDVVLGGFPCQGFSKAGPKRYSDSRNQLYEKMRDTVATLSPAAFIAENVDGLSQNFGGAYKDLMLREFRSLGYQVEYRILDAVSFGVPQHRRRIFFVGFQRGMDFHWPQPSHLARSRNGESKLASLSAPLFEANLPSSQLPPCMTIGDSVEDLVDINAPVPDHEIFTSWSSKFDAIIRRIGPGQKLCNVRHAETSVYTWQIPEAFGAVSEAEEKVLETIARHRRHKKYGNIPNGNPLPKQEIELLTGFSDISKELESLLEKGYLKIVNDRYDLKGAMFCSGLFKRPNWDEPAPTVLTNFHNPKYFLHPVEDRPFSLRECARLQGFPDGYLIQSPAVDLVSGYRLIGNAVPPPLARKLAESALAALAGRGSERGKAA
jgi:DNA (cytosine-5)-methyltransferase 1